MTSVVAVLAASSMGCSSPADDPARSSPQPTGTSAAAAASPGRPQRLYDAVGVALCDQTDLAALAWLSPTVRGTDDKPPPSAPGSACLFELAGSQGRAASLRVEAATPESVEQARLLYATTRDVTVMSLDGAVAGVGDEAEAFVRQSGTGTTTSEYMLRARQGNLVIKVWLAVTGGSATPKATMEAPVRAIAVAVLHLIPPA